MELWHAQAQKREERERRERRDRREREREAPKPFASLKTTRFQI